MSSLFKHYPSEPNCRQCGNAFTLLGNAHDTSGSFLEVFNTTRKGRNARGAATDKDQDLLRAMLTSQSLQSKDQLLRVGSFFDIQSNSITNDPNRLAGIFTARNQIVHEMDI